MGNFKEKIKENIVLIIAFFLMLGALLPYILTFSEFGISKDSNQWDHFGSYIGGIFSGLAFLGVVYQLHITKKEQEKQDFERVFFMMLEQNNVKLIELLNKRISNNDVVEHIYKEIMNYQRSASHDSLRARLEIGDLRAYYTEINSYFLNLYRLLKFIYENNNLNKSNKYSSLLRSYLPKNLLVILSYHLHKRDSSYNDYISYVNEFSFFEHLDLFVLEIKYIEKLTNYESMLIYELFNSFRLCKYTEIRSVLENLSRKPNQDIAKFKEIFEAKIENKPIEGDFRSSCHEISYENVFFYSLCTFSDKAFQGNIDYENIKIVYSKLVNYLKEKG